MGFFAVPTGKGLLFLLLAVIAAGVAFMNSGLITALTAAAFVSLCVSAFLMAFFSLAGISLSRTLPEEGKISEFVYSEVTIQNKLFLYRHTCIVTEDLPFTEKKSFTVPPLSPGETLLLPCPRKAEQRGEYTVEKVFLYSGDPLGLFRKKKTFLLPAKILIRPKCAALESLAGNAGRGGLSDTEGRNLGQAGKGMEFFGVRPYRIGDEVRHIHWKSTAAKGHLMVKEFEAAAVDRIVILLDTEKKSISNEPYDNNFEFLISCASSVTDYLGKKYCHLNFIAADGKTGFYHFDGDAASVKGKIQLALTLLQSSKKSFTEVIAASMEQIKPNSIVFLFSMSLKEISDYITILQERDCFCCWIWAPAEAFPPTEEDKARVIYPEKIRELISPLPFKPLMADFTTKADELLKSRNPYEKL